MVARRPASTGAQAKARNTTKATRSRATSSDWTKPYDKTRAGARLIISYDAAANAFTGTVENTTNTTLERVRVEVHLSNGTELGPTAPTDLAPGEKVAVTLAATSEPFDSWSAHPEVGGEDGQGNTTRAESTASGGAGGDWGRGSIPS